MDVLPARETVPVREMSSPALSNSITPADGGFNFVDGSSSRIVADPTMKPNMPSHCCLAKMSKSVTRIFLIDGSVATCPKACGSPFPVNACLKDFAKSLVSAYALAPPTEASTKM